MCDDIIISEKLRELVLDEDKIITYKYLSKICSVHVNFAKRALEQFLKSDSTLNATYFLSGFIKGENDSKIPGYLVAVVPGEKVEKAKCTFSKLDSCHVYSIQKSTIKDASILYSASNVDLECKGNERCKPVIQNETLSKSGSKPQVAKYVTQSQPSKPSPKENEKKSVVPANESPKDEKPVLEAVKTVDKSAGNKSTGKSKGSQKGQKTSIMAAFARGESTKKRSPISAPKEEVKTSKPIVKKESTTNGFTKSEESNSSSEKKKGKQNGSVAPKRNFKKIEKQMWSSSESSSEDEATPPKRSKTLSRIKQLPQSDSDDDEAKVKKELVSEEPIPNGDSTFSDNEDVIPPTPEADRTTRQYVSVTNTYEDESGFLVTRKERQLEEVPLPESSPVLSKQAVKRTQSDTKSKNSHSAAPQKNSRGKSVQDSGKKQASLMSFFTKK